MSTAIGDVEDAIRKVVGRKLEQGKTPVFTTEDLRPQLERAGLEPGQFGPFIGLLGRQGMIRKTGETVNSSVPESKGRLLQVYEATSAALAKWGIAVAKPAAPSPAMSFVDGVRALALNMGAKGYIIDPQRLANILLSARVRPFLFLYGPTGTGKSKLPELLAAELGGVFEIVSVRPNWSDSGELIGYYSVTKDEFVPGPLLRVLDSAIDNPDKLFVFVFDEMNLARVEHYLSEVLSVMESRFRTAQGIRTRPIPLETLPKGSSASTDSPILQEYDRLSRLYLPANLLLVGTVNIDETTFNFSPKVLDRGTPVEMNPGPLSRFPASASGPAHTPIAPEFAYYVFDPPGRNAVPLDVVEGRQFAPAEGARKALWDQVIADIDNLNIALQVGGFDITYRTRDAICLYMDAWHRLNVQNLLPYENAIDFCISQKVLPKLRGSRSIHSDVLVRLWEICTGAKVDKDAQDLQVPAGARYVNSARRILSLLRQYADGSFSFWIME